MFKWKMNKTVTQKKKIIKFLIFTFQKKFYVINFRVLGTLWATFTANI